MLRFFVVRLLCGIMLFSGSFSVFAWPPSPPSGMPNGWLFARYFSNIVWGSLWTGSCPAGQVIVGFSTGAGINYGVPVCVVPSSVWQQNGSSIYYNAGNVGIGTSSPSWPLHIVSDSDSPFILQTSDNTWLYTQWLQSNGTRRAWVWLNNDLSAFNIALENGTNALIIPSWNIGIGTNSPWAKLDVNGNIRSTSYGAFAQWITPALTGAPDAKIFSPSWDYLWVGTWGINYNEWTPDYIEFNNASSITSRIALDDWSAHFALWWGNVGIGTSSPWAKLEVAWQVKITGGTPWAWKVLQSDANGLASWQSISTLPSAGTAGQTLYSNGSAWVASQNIYNNGWNVWIWTTSPSWKLDVAGDIQANGGWFRVKGTNGIYWQDYGPGWYAQDATWLRTYNNASIWANTGNIGTNGSFTAGYGWTAWPAGGAIISWDVGIGVSSPTRKLDVNWYIRVRSINGEWWTILLDGNNGTNMWVENLNGDFRLINSPWNAELFKVNQSGNVYANNYYYYSDERLKTNIKTITGALDKLSRLSGYTFNWKSNSSSAVWVIAQEVEREFPQIVSESTDINWNAYKTVQYGNLVAPLIEATKELSAQNKAQQQEIDDLKKQVEELKSLISRK